jgi:hypothetical protein
VLVPSLRIRESRLCWTASVNSASDCDDPVTGGSPCRES